MKAGDKVWHIASMSKDRDDRPLGVVLYVQTRDYGNGVRLVTHRVSFTAAQGYMSNSEQDCQAGELVPVA